MKHYLLLCGVLLGVCACARTEYSAALYEIEFPAMPEAWRELLGEPRWRVEWISPQGAESLESSGNAPTLALIEAWTNPIIAYPFWLEQGLGPGMMKPAGALFPFDVEGKRIRLSWQGGIEALVYRELASAALLANKESRQPFYFNWPRFRELLADPSLNEEARSDPWLVDWKTFCLKTAQSGFDKRRIAPRETEPLLVPLNAETYWIGSSPFAPPFIQASGESLRLEVSCAIDTYVCAEGMLRCTQGAWIWQSWNKAGDDSALSSRDYQLPDSRFP
ncbi:MAG: hypothetical protein LBF87_03420 [Treponema sp.]|jgi:hypothetical protein|nr:hypothetical protein [Treponema sp.]